ncbi:MAG TPA: MBL fold metallo-hydrolase [Methylomirabilota bacterium]
MEPLIPGLVALPAHNPGPMTGPGNQTYLFTGRVPTLIDAGVGAPAHLAAVAAALEAGGWELSQVIVTHAHTDHASGAAALAERWPRAVFRKVPWPVADVRFRVGWAPVRDGDEIEAGDTTLIAVHTPGHAPDHLCLWHPATRTLLGGDLLVEGETVVIPGTRGGDLAAYLRSLEAVAALAPRRVLPAHGPPIDDPVALIRRYSAHRAARERSVLRAVRDGRDTVGAIADQVYAGLAGHLRPAAEETVQAHLNKLVAEGRVQQAGRRYSTQE